MIYPLPPSSIRLGARALLQETLNWCKISEAELTTHGRAGYTPLKLWCSQWSCPSQPKPGSKFTISLGPELGAKWRKILY